MAQVPNRESMSLPADAFVRSMAVNRNLQSAFFLGAGASISSGVRSAAMCVWRWKRDIFLSNNPGLSEQFGDVSLSSSQEKIQRWLDSQGAYPHNGAPEEYGFYAERCYPIPGDRRQFFQTLIEGTKPHIGYQLLCMLAEAEIIKSVWTTNFDGLVSRAAQAAQITVLDVGLDTAARINKPTQRGELKCVALHGDYRYDALKNTPNELRHQDKTLRSALERSLQSNTLVVIGYSGRDESIMATLRAGFTTNGSGRLYWCGVSEDIPPIVQDLLVSARQAGRDAFYVPILGFDDVLIRLASQCLVSDLHARAQQLWTSTLKGDRLESPPFVVEPGRVSGLIKSNAFPITLPGEVMQFDATGFDSAGAWQRLREVIGGSNLVGGLQRGHMVALGTVADVKQTFGETLASDVSFVPIIGSELTYSNGVIVSLLTQALVRSAAATRGLNTDGRSMLWVPEKESAQVVYGEQCYAHAAVKVYLRRFGDKNFVVLKPTIKALRPDGSDVSDEGEKEIKRRLLTRQYNNEFNKALDAWRQRLFPQKGTTSFSFPPSGESVCRFTVRSAPEFAKITSSRAPQPPIPITPQVARLVGNGGMAFAEPSLLLSKPHGDGYVADPHPLRGVSVNQPYDYQLTLNGLSSRVRLGIVCPAKDANSLSAYLAKLQLREKPDSKQEYLVEYPGFSSAFGLPLDLPQRGDEGWVDCPEPSASISAKNGALELGRLITDCINQVKSSASPSVVVVYIPDRWKIWDHFGGDGQFFNLHDFVKAYCIQHGIATQFLREATLIKQYQCEIMWWLALAFYVKSMRTPWVLDSLDSETAFVGLGLSLDPRAPRGQHVLLGCSHIYSSRGLGLNFRLGKIEHPVIRHENPYMSRDDARRMGESVRQLFYESMQSPPRRVVIHKRTPFDGAEREGLLEGLADIASVDMVEISADRALRYVASHILPNGTFQGDGFPVKRGTSIVLDSAKALLWVHGTTQPLQSSRRYYLGKSRIPTPLLLVRHHGAASLGTLATEILGLSKMNWNTADMYNKLPATIESSNTIARIGAYLERIGGGPYDYRLFI